MRSLRLLWVPAVVGACVLLTAATTACAAEKVDKAKDGFGELTVDQVQQLIDKKEVTVIDNNSRERWQKSHVPTAKWVEFSEVKTSDLPQDKDAKVVFYCANTH